MTQFNEDNTIEKLLLTTIQSNGWTYLAGEDLQRDYQDVLLDSVLKESLIRLNPCIAEDTSRADDVIHRLRSCILSVQAHNLVAQNEVFKQLLFEKNSYPFGKDGRSVSVNFFDYSDLSNNSYIVTNQLMFPKHSLNGGKRFDIVLYINGIPVVVGEVKTPVRNAISWADGAGDIASYEKSVPEMFVTNVFSFASEGKCYRYGSIGMPINLWGPWHIGDEKKEGTLADIAASAKSMLRPEVILDIMQYFTVFATDKKYRKIKVICRYQQYEAANMIVNRVKAGQPKQGLIWHFQGSGKSLLMVFAAQKLRMTPELKNPTVVIVDDRIDLETQITATFNASDIPNLKSATTKQELLSFFKTKQKKILITTIFKFGEVDGVINTDENIIVLVDEAHRTQEGDLGFKMRTALPNAFFFGLTGTPINKRDVNTFKTFGAIEVDKGGYMSKYSFSDSIRDNATLPLHFEAVPVELHVNQEAIDAAFAEVTRELTPQERAIIAQRVNLEALFTNPERIKKVCEYIVRHYKEKIEPNGYKAQVVCYNRECCMLYKRELDKLMGPEASTVVMHTEGDKADKYKEWRRNRDEEEKVLDRFRDPADPLKMVIVTSKLLTGFDAQILQAMYLDKPMKDHTLLQAICRTNRVYDSGKTYGLIVDFTGIFDDVANALDFDEKAMQKVVTNIDGVKQKLPSLMAKCLEYFEGVDRNQEGFEGLMAAQECLKTNDKKDKFAADFRILMKAWDIVSPDQCLLSLKADYVWLCRVYESVKPIGPDGRFLWAAFGPKTIDIVHQNVEVEGVNEDLETLVMNADVIDEFLAGRADATKASKKLEISLIARIRKHGNDPKFVELGKKVEELRERHEMGLIASVELLKMLLQVAKDVLEAEKTTDPEEEQDKAKAALTELFQGVKNINTPAIVERLVDEIDNVVRTVRFPGWGALPNGRKLIRGKLTDIIWVKYGIKDKELIDKAYTYVEMYY